jgi:hypothetical protein
MAPALPASGWLMKRTPPSWERDRPQLGGVLHPQSEGSASGGRLALLLVAHGAIDIECGDEKAEREENDRRQTKHDE